MRLERRLSESRWLLLAVPVGSLAAAAGIIALLLVATGHDPGHTYVRLLDSAFIAEGALSDSFTSATPLLFTGLAAAAAFRMNLFNIGGEGQLYVGAILSAGVALWIGDRSTALLVASMCVAGAAGGALWAFLPGVLRAFLRTNEIITTLMLNYVAGLILYYLVFSSQSYWRDTSSPEAKVFPQGKRLPASADWWTFDLEGTIVPVGFAIAAVIGVGLFALYRHTRFGYELQVIADSPRAAHYAGMRTRRKIVAVMCISGAVAGVGGASQNGDFRHLLDPRGLQQSYYGYTGIVVAALARYNPFAVVVVSFLLGGLQNAGFTLQGSDFPSGLVGVMQGVILFCALGGELLARYRVRLGSLRRTRETAATGAAPESL